MTVRKILFAGAAAAACLAAAGVATPVSAGTSHPVFRTEALPGSSGSSEPRVTVTADGTSYVVTNASDGTETIYAARPGRPFSRTTGTPPDQTLPTTDVDIVSLPSGRLVTSELDYAGINFITAWSDDHGKTWTESTGTTAADTDRQWFAVGPVDPTTHQRRVYLLFHNLLSGAASHNMFVATSTDGGKTFGAPVPVARPGQQDWADLQCADSGGPSNIFYDQHSNRVFVAFGTRSSPAGGCAAQPVEINVVAANRVWVVAAPAQQTTSPTAWTPHLAVNDTGSPSHIVGMQLAPAASDTAGNVYVAYPESINDYPDYDGAAIKVVHASGSSLDRWSRPSVVARSGKPGNILPHIVAGSPGKVDVAWVHGERAGAGVRWFSTMAQSLDALGPTPHWSTQRLSSVVVEPSSTASQLMGACLDGPTATLNGFYCGRAADVYGVALDRCGGLVVTWPAQANQATDATYVARQTAGPRLLSCGSVRGRPVSGGVSGAGSSAGGGGAAAVGGRSLASSGAPGLLAYVGAALVAAAVVLRRRTGRGRGRQRA